MAHYIFEGLAPADDGGGGLNRPLDVREFAADPGRPWRELDDPEAAEKPAKPPEPEAAPKVTLTAPGGAAAPTAPGKPAGTTED